VGRAGSYSRAKGRKLTNDAQPSTLSAVRRDTDPFTVLSSRERRPCLPRENRETAKIANVASSRAPGCLLEYGIVRNRRNLTPPRGVPSGEVHATRRCGARLEVTARATLRSVSGKVLEGWALNVSRGGVRVILEEKVDPGAEFEVTLSGGIDVAGRPGPQVGRIVWVQEEPDGVVAGIEFRSEGEGT
jgi:hypothetical protein